MIFDRQDKKISNCKIFRFAKQATKFSVGCFFAFLLSFWVAQAAKSPDAIAMRIYSNPDHMSALSWYRSQDFKGSPQSTMVDGYEAVRDGRTVYVNAGNVSGNALYTNIYLISYNSDAEAATIDIFGRMLERWKFNTNNTPDFSESGECKISTIVCNSEVNCPADYKCETAKCVPNNPKKCLSDSQCPQNLLCDSHKAMLTRDVKRLSDLQFLNALLKQKSPSLEAGTYKRYMSVSTWPSWQQTLGVGFGAGLPVDPVNVFGPCRVEAGASPDPRTCWDEIRKDYYGEKISGGAVDGSYLYYYQYNPEEKTGVFRTTKIESKSFGIASNIDL